MVVLSKQRVVQSRQRVVESIFPQDFAEWFHKKKDLRDDLYDLLHTLMAHKPCTDIYDGTRDECSNPSCQWTSGLWRHLERCRYCEEDVFVESHMLIRHWVECHSNLCDLCKDMVTPRDLDLESFDFLLKVMGDSCSQEPMTRNAQVLLLYRIRRQIQAPDSSFHRCYLCRKKKRAMLKRKPLKPTKAHLHVRPLISTTGRPLTVQEVLEEGVECQGMDEYQDETGVPEEHLLPEKDTAEQELKKQRRYEEDAGELSAGSSKSFGRSLGLRSSSSQDDHEDFTYHMEQTEHVDSMDCSSL